MITHVKEDINLLPPEAKRERGRSIFHAKVSLLYWSIVVGVGIIVATLAAIFGVQYQVLSPLLVDGNMAGDRGSVPSVDSTNRLLSEARTRVQEHTAWTERIDDVLSAVPTGVRITSLSVKGIPSVMVVEGQTASRVAVVDYQRALEELDGIARVEAPLKNFAGGNVISFSFTLSHK